MSEHLPYDRILFFYGTVRDWSVSSFLLSFILAFYSVFVIHLLFFLLPWFPEPTALILQFESVRDPSNPAISDLPPTFDDSLSPVSIHAMLSFEGDLQDPSPEYTLWRDMSFSVVGTIAPSFFREEDFGGEHYHVLRIDISVSMHDNLNDPVDLLVNQTLYDQDFDAYVKSDQRPYDAEVIVQPYSREKRVHYMKYDRLVAFRKILTADSLSSLVCSSLSDPRGVGDGKQMQRGRRPSENSSDEASDQPEEPNQDDSSGSSAPSAPRRKVRR
jgi:hypothetical protein